MSRAISGGGRLETLLPAAALDGSSVEGDVAAGGAGP
jgi:hypothetical protein